MDKFEILKVAAKNLRDIEYKYVFGLVSELGLNIMISFKIPEGVSILRLRPSTGKPFTHQSQISYNPNAKTYGRANNINCPLFYGSFAAPNMQNPILTNTAEMLHVLENGNHNITDNPIEFTIGKWRVEKKLPVIPMIFYKQHLSKNKMFRPLYEKYLKANKFSNRNREIIQFIAQEFAKSDIKSHHEYKITTAFTDLMFKNYKRKIEAIIYPSVRVNGDGFNIAMTPEFLERHLRLDSVMTMNMYHKNGVGVLDPEKMATTIAEDKTFELTPITKPGVTKGRDWCMNETDQLNNKL